MTYVLKKINQNVYMKEVGVEGMRVLTETPDSTQAKRYKNVPHLLNSLRILDITYPANLTIVNVKNISVPVIDSSLSEQLEATNQLVLKLKRRIEELEDRARRQATGNIKVCSVCSKPRHALIHYNENVFDYHTYTP